MERAELTRQMSDVVDAARDALRDPAKAARLWGCASELCDLLERENHGDTEPMMIIALREDIRTGARCTEELAEEIVWFVRAIERDLADEERDAIVADVVSCDQTDG